MIATGYEEDQRFYKKYSKDSDALVSDSNENFLYYRCGVILLAAQSLRIVVSWTLVCIFWPRILHMYLQNFKFPYWTVLTLNYRNNFKLIIPNKLEINRKRNLRREKLIDRSHYKNVFMRNNINTLEAYQDLAYGTVIFNISGLPRNECEAFRSISKISDGELLKSKLE